jgi:2-polyprenyl-3-methyl-5-hydroxy-6-metoxy-1,4-benzoquinol methylase
MHATYPLLADESTIDVASPDVHVTLADGETVSLTGLSGQELHALQWQQEQVYARAIMACPKGSRERSLVVREAYDTICTILSAQATSTGQPLVMGLDKRYVRLVLGMLRRQSEAGHKQPRLFEVGYGCGALVAEVRGHGYAVGGIDVSPVMREQAIEIVGERYAASLLLGDLRSVDVESLNGQPTLVYWNDVFEHIPPDEISEYLSHIYQLLAPGGALVTITPNWLLRPMDVTGDFCPPRTIARGLHLKEYRLAAVTRLLRQSGFRRVATPLLATRRRLVTCGGGGRVVKQWIEPWLDRVPVLAARLVCRGLAMSATIATK